MASTMVIKTEKNVTGLLSYRKIEHTTINIDVLLNVVNWPSTGNKVFGAH